MMILGIDGSLTATGYAMWSGALLTQLHAEGCVRTKPNKRARRTDDDGRRIDEIARALAPNIERADLVAIEALGGVGRAGTAKALALVYGCTRTLCWVHGKPVVMIGQAAAKKAAGSPRSKAAMVAWAEAWGGPIVARSKVEREAIADARALVHAAMQTRVTARAA